MGFNCLNFSVLDIQIYKSPLIYNYYRQGFINDE
jgi:hypothetical protein